MDAVEYLRNKMRFEDAFCRSSCTRCPFNSTNNGQGVECEDLEVKHPETAVEIVEKWSAEHPVKTRQSEFLKLFPNANIDPEGVLRIDPCFIDGKITDEVACNKFSGCLECRKNYWLAEVE